MGQRHAPALVQGSEGLPEIRLERVGDGADIPGDLRIGLPVRVRLHDGAAAVQNAVRCGVQCQADMRDACPAEPGLDDAGSAADLRAVAGDVPPIQTSAAGEASISSGSSPVSVPSAA